MKETVTLKLDEHLTFKKIYKYTINPILMMVFISLYGIVDGFFVSNFAGADAYAGLNLIIPYVFIIGGTGFIFGSGGSALVGKLLGEGNKKRANEVFTMVVKISAIVGLAISFLGFIFIKPICYSLGSITEGTTEGMIQQAIIYSSILIGGQVLFMIQSVFHSFLIVDGKPKLAFRITLIGGLTNMLLDYLFVGVFKWGIAGASVATLINYLIGSLIPILHFLNNKDGNIRFVKTKIESKPVWKTILNGSSEFVSNISSNVVGLLFNIQLLVYYQDVGVSAYGTLMCVSFIYAAVYIGYCIGLAPVISYNYGAKNHQELSSILKKSLFILTGLSIAMVAVSELLGPLFAYLFVGKYEEVYELTKLAFRIFSIQFLFCGFSIFLSSFFTALNNGLISALISFLRTLVIQMGCVLILPSIVGGVGIWWSNVIAEVIAFMLSFIFLFVQAKKYKYFEKVNLVG